MSTKPTRGTPADTDPADTDAVDDPTGPVSAATGPVRDADADNIYARPGDAHTGPQWDPKIPPRSVDFEDPDFNDILAKCKATLVAKGRDYTMGSDTRLHNFNTVGEFVEIPRMKALAVYWYKHVTAVFSYIKTGGQSESEPIAERIVDNINYLLLLHKMICEDRRVATLGTRAAAADQDRGTP